MSNPKRRPKRSHKPEEPWAPKPDGVIRLTRSKIITLAGKQYVWYETEDGGIKQKFELTTAVDAVMGKRNEVFCYYKIVKGELQLLGEPEVQSYGE